MIVFFVHNAYNRVVFLCYISKYDINSSKQQMVL